MNNPDRADKKIREGFVGQKMIVLPPNIKRSLANNALVKHLYPTAMGFYPHAGFHDRERTSGCSDHILLYCTSGTGTVRVNTKVSKLSPNDFVWLPKNIPHQYTSSKDDPWTIYWVHFLGEYADLLYKRYLDINEEPVFIAYNEERIRKFDSIFRLSEDCFDMMKLEIGSIKLQEFISDFIYAPIIDPDIPKNDKISDSISFMKENISHQISVKGLAQQQNLSITHYSRMFRARTGSSPNQFFSELKIQKSCQYLYFTDRSIKEICNELGFRDPYYFSRLFKKLMGDSPAKYKNRYKRAI
jgi:AraC-like DNA-binding protein